MSHLQLLWCSLCHLCSPGALHHASPPPAVGAPRRLCIIPLLLQRWELPGVCASRLSFSSGGCSQEAKRPPQASCILASNLQAKLELSSPGGPCLPCELCELLQTATEPTHPPPPTPPHLPAPAVGALAIPLLSPVRQTESCKTEPRLSDSKAPHTLKPLTIQ